MGLVDLYISLVSQDHKPSSRCIQILKLKTQDTASLRQAQAQVTVACAHKADNVKLLYRGLPIDLSTRLYHLLPANIGRRVFLTATFEKRHKWSSNSQIFIRGVDSKTLVIDANLCGSCDQVQQIVGNMQGMKTGNFHLSHQGRRLSCSMNLASYGIRPGSTILQTVPVCGGSGLETRMFVDITRKNAMEHMTIEIATPDTPKWRIVWPGLILEGTCSKRACKAYNERIYASRGMGVYSLTADISCCPSCSEPFQPVTCGLLDCEWMYEGRKAGTGSLASQVLNLWQAQKGPQVYHRFQAEDNKVAWYNLIMCTRPIDSQPNTCVLCFKPISPGDTTVDHMGCDHVMHVACLGVWRQSNPEPTCCPDCGVPIEAADAKEASTKTLLGSYLSRLTKKARVGDYQGVDTKEGDEDLQSASSMASDGTWAQIDKPDPEDIESD